MHLFPNLLRPLTKSLSHEHEHFFQISKASSKKSRSSYDDGWGDYGRVDDDDYYEEVKVVKKAAAANKRGKNYQQFDEDEQVRLSPLLEIEYWNGNFSISISMFLFCQYHLYFSLYYGRVTSLMTSPRRTIPTTTTGGDPRRPPRSAPTLSARPPRRRRRRGGAGRRRRPPREGGGPRPRPRAERRSLASITTPTPMLSTGT